MTTPKDLSPRVAVLETKVLSIEELIKEIKSKLDGLQTTLEQRTIPLNSITWKVLALVGTFGSLLIGSYLLYNSNSIASVKESVDKAEVRTNDSINAVEMRLNYKIAESERRINDRLKELSDEIKGVSKTFINSPVDVANTMKRAFSAKPRDLHHTLPFSNQVLQTAREKRIPLKSEQIKEIAQPLLKVEQPELDVKKWETITTLAEYKSYSEGLKGIPASSVDSDGRRVVKCEGDKINLGENRYEDTIFANCEVVYESGAIELKNVRFLNSTFSLSAGIPNARKFLTAFLNTDEPAISLTLAAPPQADGADIK